jgi:hypothetical protein
MNSSNDKLLYTAAKDGDLEKVIKLLSKGARTSYRAEVNYLIIFLSMFIDI